MSNNTLSSDTLLDFSDTRQSLDYTCGASTVQAILYYYGFDYREDQLVNILRTNPKDGTKPSEIIALCRRLGLNVRQQHKMTIKHVIKCFHRKIPILVLFQAWDHDDHCWDNGHYSIIIGIISDKLIFEDPSLIGRGYVTIDKFLGRWYDRDTNGHQVWYHDLRS
jgi:predicted double-glycine peptidase